MSDNKNKHYWIQPTYRHNAIKVCASSEDAAKEEIARITHQDKREMQVVSCKPCYH